MTTNNQLKEIDVELKSFKRGIRSGKYPRRMFVALDTPYGGEHKQLKAVVDPATGKKPRKNRTKPVLETRTRRFGKLERYVDHEGRPQRLTWATEDFLDKVKKELV